MPIFEYFDIKVGIYNIFGIDIEDTNLYAIHAKHVTITPKY